MSATISSAVDRIPGSSHIPRTIHQLLCDECYQRRALHADCSRLTKHEVVIDCSGVDMISSEDLNALIRFHSRLRHESAALVLENVPAQIAKIFTLTRLNRLFSVHEAIA